MKLEVQKRGFDTSYIYNIKNENRKYEWLNIRLLLSNAVENCSEIIYNEFGKPYLKNESTHISISHSKNKIAIITNKNNHTGVDIQFVHPKIMRIRNKFLSELELENIDNITNEKLTAYWSAKEALFKVYGKDDIFLKENIFINDFDFNPHGGILNGRLLLKDFPYEFTLHYQLVDNYVLAYVVNP